jgi:hypothetical protein
VDQYIGHVVPTVFESEKLHVEQMREPRHRKPIGRLARSEGPPDSGRRDTVTHMGLGRYIIGIVEVDEVGLGSWEVRNDRGQKKAGVNRMKPIGTGLAQGIVMRSADAFIIL